MPVADAQHDPRHDPISAEGGRPSLDDLRSDLVGWGPAEHRRVLEAYAAEVYGRPPEAEVDLSWQILRESPGPAGSVRRQISLELRPHGTAGGQGPETEPTADADPSTAARLTLLIQIPETGSSGSGPAGNGPAAGTSPAFLGLNFLGNHTLTEDPAILDPAQVSELGGSALHYEGKASAQDGPTPRGSASHTWPAELIARRGYVSITASYLEIGPDTPSIFSTGLHPVLSSAGFEDRQADTWGAISLWAWALQRVLDALEQGMVPEVDPARVIVHGHSRLGKTALWAAAQDQRFAGAISNNSGCMGAAIDREVGESHEVITTAFPHWFAPSFVERIAEGRAAPLDQHQLLATIAPRPLYVASASEDLHADPEGEFLAWAVAAGAWGADGSVAAFPAPEESAHIPDAPLGYHLRRGEHSVQPFDWKHWLDFADRWVPSRP